ncbi:MAG: adenylate/guanylate cyclase domain-containing protein [Gammaproteobacteria bacterium]|nr:adenylate/guanylate cyclase domain-containing protein [Gammaproteobacteria bacterium]
MPSTGIVRRTHNWLAGKRHTERLPARVTHAIERQQEASEILVGWVQFGILATFAALYTLAPKTFAEDADFAPVPWALGIYSLFTAVRLVLAHARRIPYWMLFLSVVVDMALLLGLIWSFHLQYEQPASFYLKVPTVLYVFIFIALRALRFEAGFVVLSGLVAATGWLLLVWYATHVDPQNPMITRDYVEYMTSNSVLLGAEFDKVISILMVTAILAVAIARARGLLVRSVIESSAARDLSKFVPLAVAQQIASAEEAVAAGQGETHEATILFIDIEGFTTLSEQLTPEQLIGTLNEYFAVVSAPLQAHGGAINQFQGDAILATFNVPTEHPQHASNAVHAALEIQRELRRHTFGDGMELRARIGINTGTVVGGMVGTPDRLAYTVHGDDVNLAARLETLNKEYGTYILLSASTAALATDLAGEFRELGEVRVRGKRGVTRIYTVALK